MSSETNPLIHSGSKPTIRGHLSHLVFPGNRLLLGGFNHPEKKKHTAHCWFKSWEIRVNLYHFKIWQLNTHKIHGAAIYGNMDPIYPSQHFSTSTSRILWVIEHNIQSTSDPYFFRDFPSNEKSESSFLGRRHRSIRMSSTGRPIFSSYWCV